MTSSHTIPTISTSLRSPKKTESLVKDAVLEVLVWDLTSEYDPAAAAATAVPARPPALLASIAARLADPTSTEELVLVRAKGANNLRTSMRRG